MKSFQTRKMDNWKPKHLNFQKIIAIFAFIVIVSLAILNVDSNFKNQLTQENLVFVPTDYISHQLTSESENFLTIEGISCIPQTNKRVDGKVVRVVDGDTIIVNIAGIEYKIRYIGINSPESRTIGGADATNYNKSLVEGKNVVLVKDVSETDIYNRLLRYVIVENKFINYEMIISGWAKSGSWSPDTSCDQNFYSAEQTAMINKLGIWNNNFTPSPTITSNNSFPSTGLTQTVDPDSIFFISQSCPYGCISSSANCAIKGNISSSGEKIYHLPGSTSYEATKISTEKGELWFCTEEEAIANGWRKRKY